MSEVQNIRIKDAVIFRRFLILWTFFFGGVFLQGCGKKQESIKPEIGTITEAVYATGRVLAKNQYTVFPTVNGIVLKSLKLPGDSVHAGDTLFVMDDEISGLNKEQSRAILEFNNEKGRIAAEKLQEAQSTLLLAIERYQLDSSLWQRQKKLWDSGIGSKLELEQKELAFETSKRQKNSALSTLNQLKLQIAHEADRAEIGYRISEKTNDDFIITSKINGVVYDVRRELNEFVTPQTPLAVVGNSDEFYLELQVDEYDITKLKIGQKVLVTLDAYRGEVFEAQLKSIFPIMDEKSRSFVVTAEFIQVPTALYPNISVEANIVLNQKTDALIIPRRYVESDRFVYVSETEKVEIIPGLKNYQQIEVLSGVSSDQEIFLPPVK